jgi:uroporphyrinogen-III synthase
VKKKLVLIRDQDSALETVRVLGECGVECLSFPLLSYRPLDCKTELLTLLSGLQPESFLFASRRAYDYFCGIYTFRTSDYAELSIFTIGERAANKARADGFQKVRAFPDFAGFVSFFKVPGEMGKIVFYPCSANAVSRDIITAKENGIDLREFFIYEVISAGFCQELSDLLHKYPQLPVAAFSISQAEELIRHYPLVNRPVFCLGQRTAECFSETGCRILISPVPTMRDFVQFVATAVEA